MKKYLFCIPYIVFMLILLYKPKYENNYKLVAISDNSYLGLSNFNEKYIEENYYNGESVDEIVRKISRYMSSGLKNDAEFIVRYSIKRGVDPYLSASVILHETGCEWTCSYLSRVCNNFAGNKGSPGCNGGSYRRFNSREEGLTFAINKLGTYIDKGKTTPEEIGPSYATSTAWPTRVKNYMNKLKKD